MKLEDCNTGYFHAITKTQKCLNAFSVLENEHGILVHKEEEIVKVLGNYFQQLFTNTPRERERTENRTLQLIISEEENAHLISVPSASEIKEAVLSINAEKITGSGRLFGRIFPYSLGQYQARHSPRSSELL